MISSCYAAIVATVRLRMSVCHIGLLAQGSEVGLVGVLQDQHVGGAPCGCCWAFATIGVSECIVAMATGKVLSLSEQQLIDCDHAGEAFYRFRVSAAV